MGFVRLEGRHPVERSFPVDELGLEEVEARLPDSRRRRRMAASSRISRKSGMSL
jgi:hypothetical protein